VRVVSVARQISTIEELYQDQIVCFSGKIKGAKVTNPRTVLGSSPGEDVGFRNNNFSCVIQRSVSNDRANDKLSGNKDCNLHYVNIC
jgi:hypothetical protein